MRILPPCPTFEDPEADLRARNLYHYLIAILALAPLSLVLLVVNPGASTRWLALFAAHSASSGLCLVLLYRRVRIAAGWTAVASLALVSTLTVMSAGGTSSYGFPYFILVILVAGSVLGRAAGIAAAAYSIAAQAAMALLQASGVLRSSPVNTGPLNLAVNNSLFLVAVVAFDSLATGQAEHVLRMALRELFVRKEAEEALRASESYRRLLFDDSHIPLIVMDPVSQTFTDCNAAAVRAYGLASRDQVIGLTALSVSTPTQYDGRDSGSAAMAWIAEALKTGSAVFEWRHRRPDGSEWDAEVRLKNFEMGGASLMQFALIDITARKRAEAEIRALNARLEVRVAERTAELSAANESLETAINRLTESREQALRNARMAALGQLASGIAHEINTPLGALISASRQLEEPGKLLGEALAFSASLDPEGSVILGRLLGLIHEETAVAPPDRGARKILRAALAEAEIEEADELAEEIGDLGIRLSPEELTLLARHPAFVPIARVACRAGVFVRSRWIVQNAAERVASAVRAMRHYGRRADEGEFGPASIGRDLEAALALFALRAKKELSVVSEIAELPPVYCHPDKLCQVWINLIDNALQSMRYRGTLTIRAREEDGRVLVSIEDDGPGVPVEIRDRIFEPFFTTKPRGSGTGLGLDICKRVVEEIGGSIGFESEAGRTVFTVSLDASKAR